MPGDYGLPRVRCAYPGYVARETAIRLLPQADLLRNEDIRIMRELGRMRQHSMLVGELNHIGDDGLRLQPAF